MKKLFLGMAAVALLASCSNDEIIEQSPKTPISFKSFVNKSTRADVIGENFTEFSLYGWRGDDVFFDATPVIKSEAGWSYGDPRHWEDYNYDFEAISPKSGEGGVTFDPEKTGGDFTFEAPADDDVDLIYAKSTTIAGLNQSAPVELNFKHLLSRVKFTFVNDFPVGAAAEISIKNLKIIDAPANGKLTTLGLDGENATKWVVSGNDNVITFDNVDAIPAQNTDGTATNTSKTNHKYLIPSGIVAKYNVTFDLIVTQGGLSSTYPKSTTITATFNRNCSYDFVALITTSNVLPPTTDPDNPDGPGIPTKMQKIEFKPVVSDWGDFDSETPTGDIEAVTVQ